MHTLPEIGERNGRRHTGRAGIPRRPARRIPAYQRLACCGPTVEAMTALLREAGATAAEAAAFMALNAGGPEAG